METSKEVKNLVTALNKVNQELDNPPATTENPFYKSKYTPLDQLINHIKDVINENNLFVVQTSEIENGYTIVKTRLFHESGEWIETKAGVPTGTDPQKQGACLTYARRYGLSQMFNIASDPDNDANETVTEPGVKKQNRIDFDEVRKKISTMTIDELKSYWIVIETHYSLSDAQNDALKNIFGQRKLELK